MIAELTVPVARHERIDRLEAEIMLLPKADIEIRHHFSPGLYAREMLAPAGSVITGKIHKTRHLNIVASGRLTVYNELGDLREIVAPYVYVSEPGTRRAAIIHEDVSWITVHPTDETDIEKLEALLVEDYENPLTLGMAQPASINEGESP
jgi:hypothetical protein